MSLIYTIGYANKSTDLFISQLEKFKINYVVDIRSVPYSNYHFDFNQDRLSGMLKKTSLNYVYMGNELGPRSKSESHYDSSGQVQFDRLMQSESFLSGIERLENGVKQKLTLALMCAEKDPATCHRSLLVGYFLKRNSSMDIMHIDHDGNAENQSELEKRLADINKVETDMFMTEQQQIEISYQMQIKRYAYKKPDV